MCILGEKKKWKSWNIIAIQAGSGESRISVDDVEPGSKLERLCWLELGTNGNTG